MEQPPKRETVRTNKQKQNLPGHAAPQQQHLGFASIPGSGQPMSSLFGPCLRAVQEEGSLLDMQQVMKGLGAFPLGLEPVCWYSIPVKVQNQTLP